MKKPIKTIRIGTDTRTYYVDLRLDGKERGYVTLTELPTEESERKEKARIFIHLENIDRLVAALEQIKNEAKAKG